MFYIKLIKINNYNYQEILILFLQINFLNITLINLIYLI